jgi:hypothetical protein
MHIKFWLGSLRERDHLEDLGVGKMDLKKIGMERVDLIYLAQDRDQW